MNSLRTTTRLILASLLLLSLWGCPPIDDPPPDAVDDGEIRDDADQTTSETTDPPDGVDPDTGVPLTTPVQSALLLAPNGRFVVSHVPAAARRCVQVLDLQTEAITPFADLCDVRWVAFANDASTIFVLDSAGTALHEIATSTMSRGPVHTLRSAYGVITVARDGRAVALANTPTTEWAESQYDLHTYDLPLRTLAVVDRARGVVQETLLPYAIRDLDFSPVDGALMITMSWWKETGLPEAVIQFWDIDAGAVTDVITFSNCADDLVVMPEGPYALLSPNRCFTHGVTLARAEPVVDDFVDENGNGWPDDQEWTDDEWNENWEDADPISIIDLHSRSFLGNTPGFGPVALSPVEGLAVGFTRLETMMLEWNHFQTQSVGLIFVELEGFDWQVVELGDYEPHFFFAPDGQTVLVYTADDPAQRLRMVDRTTLTVSPVGGAQVDPTRHVWTDADTLFVVDRGSLFVAARGALELHPVPSTPGVGHVDRIGRTPLGDRLILGASDSPAIHVFDVASRTVTRSYFQ